MDEFSKPSAGAIIPGRSAAGIAGTEAIPGITSEADAISESELLEFLAADVLGVPSDPTFKRKLKGRLWDIVQTRLQKKQRHKWMSGWRRRNISAAGETDGAAKLKG